MNHPVATRVLQFCAEGPFALFTNPAFKTERLSYDAMTPTAASGLVQAILWKPAVRVQIERIDVCEPIRKHTMTLNGVDQKIQAPKARHYEDPGSLVLDAVAHRMQMRETRLLDVKYVVHFRYVMTEHAGRDDNPVKFEEIFERRIQRGQFFKSPHFGLQQLEADCRPVQPGDRPLVTENRDLGMMPHHRIYSESSVETVWFHANLVEGVLWVPPPEEIGDDSPHAQQRAKDLALEREHEREGQLDDEFAELERRQRLELEELERLQARERAELARKRAAEKDSKRRGGRRNTPRGRTRS